MPTPHQVLKQYWGYDEFRPLQLDIVESALAGNDTLALLPTGGGKSICFQVPALCKSGVCIVVSPLIALMKDQVHNLKKRGINAHAIFSGMAYKDIDRILDNCVHGEVKFLYLSPERLATDLARERIRRMNVSFIAVDEAHCISQWGYDFRPSYMQIATLRELKPDVPVIALTATATAPVVADIQTRLAFTNDPNRRRVFQKSFARDNLAYIVLHEENKLAKLLEILQRVQGSGVVYVQNRRETKDIAQFLQRNGISADFYHAGLSPDQRSTIQDKWINNQIRIIVSTNAFGMGIDKPDVRVVVHLTMPESLEAYFQEAGRGGRDGNKAYAVLLYNQNDRQKLERQYEVAFPPLKDVRNVYRALGSYYQLAIGSAAAMSFDFDVVEFCKRYDFDPIFVLNALKILAQEGYLEVSEQIFQPPTLQILVSREQLYDYLLKNQKLQRLLNLILRSFQGVANHDVQVNEYKLAGAAGMDLPILVQTLQKLHQEQIIRYTPQKDSPQLTFLTERLHENDVVFDRERYEFLRSRYLERMTASLNYAESTRCRSQLLLEYFNERNAPTCGKCDVCTGMHDDHLTAEQFETFKTQLRTLLQQKALPLTQITRHFPSNLHARLLKAIEFLVDNQFLIYTHEKFLRWRAE